MKGWEYWDGYRPPVAPLPPYVPGENAAIDWWRARLARLEAKGERRNETARVKRRNKQRDLFSLAGMEASDA